MAKRKFKIINERAAGIDIGSREIFIALHNGEVKSFGTFTSDFKSAVNYLLDNNLTTVAMESTGLLFTI